MPLKPHLRQLLIPLHARDFVYQAHQRHKATTHLLSLAIRHWHQPFQCQPPIKTGITKKHPLQSEMSQHHRVLHTHMFKEVTTYQSGTPVRRLMITEVDSQGTECNRQPEFFFNGMIGHVQPRGGGYVDSWAEATCLSNYWRQFYNIDQVYEDHSAWYPQDHQYHGSPRNAALGGEAAEISDLADDTSVAVETGQLSVPTGYCPLQR